MLPHAQPHYMEPFQELLQRGGVFDVLEQLLAFFRHLHIYVALHGLIYNSFSQKQNGVKL
jgi:hypothetical protein